MSNGHLSQDQKSLMSDAEELAHEQFNVATAIVKGRMRLDHGSAGYDAAVTAVMQVLASNYHASVLKNHR